MSTYTTPESKKEEFRKYLEKSGVIDAVTKVLVSLYEEPQQPTNAVEYIKRLLGSDSSADVDSIRAENDQLKQRVTELEEQLTEAQKKLTEAPASSSTQ